MRAAFEQVPGEVDRSWHLERRHEDEFGFAYHFHPEYELTLIQSGTGERYVGGDVARYEPGDLVLVGENLSHAWRSHSPGPHAALACQFLRPFLGPTFFDLPEFADVAALLDRSASGLHFPAAENADVIDQVCAMADRPPARQTTGLLEVLLTLAQRPAIRLSTTTAGYRLDRAGQERMQTLIGFLNDRYAGDVDLAEAAAVVAMTPASLSRFVRRTSGKTVTDILNDIRCAAASRMLVETEQSVSAIAAGCGYANLSNFNRRFKERFSVTPRDYRASFRPH